MTAPAPSRRRDGEGGFSLVEVLVTLTILAAFMAVFTPFVGRLMSGWARNADGAQRADMVATAIDRIAADAASALPLVEFRDGAEPRIRFTGTPSGYSMVVAGDKTETVAVSSNAGGRGTHSVVRVSEVAARSNALAEPASRVALLDYPVTAEFAYRSSKGSDSSDWRDAPTLPSAIVVTFRRGKDVMFGGPVVVPVRATLPVDCVVDKQPQEAVCGKVAPAPNPEGEQQPPSGSPDPSAGPAKEAAPTVQAAPSDGKSGT